MAVPIDEALAHDERAERFLTRLMTAFASSGIAWGAGSIPLPVTERTHREETERVIRVAAAQADGCVISGRAAAIVLRDHPHALFVRLEGSFEGRVRSHVTSMASN